MKANFILGKKQIILASLVVILGAAVYLNYTFANNSNDLKVTDQVEATTSDVQTDAAASVKTKTDGKPAATVKSTDASPASSQETIKTGADVSKTKVLGEAKFVSSKSIVDDDYFAEAQLARTKSRDEAIETVSSILNNDKLTESDKKTANTKAMKITDMIEAESRMESLVKAKGFSECMVYLTDASANVVVKTEGLTQDQATQIKNIVVTEGKIKGENVSITEVK